MLPGLLLPYLGGGPGVGEDIVMTRKFRPSNALSPILAILLASLVPGIAAAQRGTIDSGATITVRTNETINTKDSDGQVFTGVIENDVMNRNGRVAIPRGSEAELVTRQISNDEIALDLDSVVVNGQRYLLDTDESSVDTRKDGIGANKRTGKYVGGGALLGAIIGGITGGGKGAAIGAGAGAAAGAGAQVLTRGRSINIPAESVLTFRLNEPLSMGPANTGFSRSGRRFQRQSYSNGGDQSFGNRYGANSNFGSRLSVGSDNMVRWNAPGAARVYVQTDNGAPKLFAEAPNGEQAASWIAPGHMYVFTLRDSNGSELAREQVDTRRGYQRGRSY
jgi:hypothetical protein